MDNPKLTAYERGLLILALLVSLALRLSALDVFRTSDEEQWRQCSLRFTTALQNHDWAATYQMGHPGVLTMWLGTVSARLPLLQQPWVFDSHRVREMMGAPALTPGTGLPSLTLGARRLVALVTWLGILALFALLRKLFSDRMALLATVLLALDPFFLAHSRLHHVDALLATFTTLSVVSLLVYQFRGRQSGYLLLSATTAGLAVASKSPGVLLAPCAALILLLPSLYSQEFKRSQALRHALGALIVWGVLAGLTLLAVWPAMWVSPLETLQKVFGMARLSTENPHEHSNFFWFAVRPDPGLGFYPVAWAMRTTPWVLLGLAAWAGTWRKRKPGAAAGLLVLAALIFGGVMALGDKKFDRYLLPTFLLVDILAALGWLALLQYRFNTTSLQEKRWAPAVLVALLAVGQFALGWPTRPYYLPYYNPLLGGSRTAPQVLLVGWGEGLDRAAAYLNAKPNAGDLVASSWRKLEFEPFFLGRTVKTTDPAPLAVPDYFVFYSNMLQRHIAPEITQRFVGSQEPEHIVRIHGIDYVWIYENTVYRQAEDQILAQVNPETDAILLDIEATLARRCAGKVPVEVFRGSERDDVVRTALQHITAGRKRVWHVIYPDAAQEVSPLMTKYLKGQATASREIRLDGGVQAICYDLPAALRFVPEPSITVGARFEQITLVGYEISKTEFAPGDKFRIRFHWQASKPASKSYTVFTHFIGPDGAAHGQMDGLPQGGGRCTDSWQAGEVILDDHDIEIPLDAPEGEYTVVVGLYDRSTMERVPASDPAGNPLVENALRLGGFKVTRSRQ